MIGDGSGAIRSLILAVDADPIAVLIGAYQAHFKIKPGDFPDGRCGSRGHILRL
jgi:hypothetical protein